eukprot:g44547.t1
MALAAVAAGYCTVVLEGTLPSSGPPDPAGGLLVLQVTTAQSVFVLPTGSDAPAVGRRALQQGTATGWVWWGDGTAAQPCPGTQRFGCTHVYQRPGNYTVTASAAALQGWSMDEDWRRAQAGAGANAARLVRIERWGGLRLHESRGHHFWRADGLEYLPPLAGLATAGVRSFAWSWAQLPRLCQELAGLSTEAARSLEGAFAYSPCLRVDLRGSDTGLVEEAQFLLAGTDAEVVPGLESLNTSSLRNASHLFYNARNLAVAGALAWAVPRLRDASWMFAGAARFNSALSGWAPASLDNLDGMFYEARSFNQPLAFLRGPRLRARYAQTNATSFAQPLAGWAFSTPEDEQEHSSTCHELLEGNGLRALLDSGLSAAAVLPRVCLPYYRPAGTYCDSSGGDVTTQSRCHPSNGGMCVETGVGYRCDCRPGYYLHDTDWSWFGEEGTLSPKTNYDWQIREWYLQTAEGPARFAAARLTADRFGDYIEFRLPPPRSFSLPFLDEVLLVFAGDLSSSFEAGVYPRLEVWYTHNPSDPQSWWEHSPLIRRGPPSYLGTNTYAKWGIEDYSYGRVVESGPIAMRLHSPACLLCPAGYTTPSESQRACVDADECTQQQPCDAQRRCMNTVGSYVCTDCPLGYLNQGQGACLDINECATDNGGCGHQVVCRNVPGNWSYECSEGGVPTIYCGPGQCVNTPGSYYCACGLQQGAEPARLWDLPYDPVSMAAYPVCQVQDRTRGSAYFYCNEDPVCRMVSTTEPFQTATAFNCADGLPIPVYPAQRFRVSYGEPGQQRGAAPYTWRVEYRDAAGEYQLAWQFDTALTFNDFYGGERLFQAPPDWTPRYSTQWRFSVTRMYSPCVLTEGGQPALRFMYFRPWFLEAAACASCPVGRASGGGPSAQCSCPSGYKLDEAQACVELDECATGGSLLRRACGGQS